MVLCFTVSGKAFKTMPHQNGLGMGERQCAINDCKHLQKTTRDSHPKDACIYGRNVSMDFSWLFAVHSWKHENNPVKWLINGYGDTYMLSGKTSYTEKTWKTILNGIKAIYNVLPWM